MKLTIAAVGRLKPGPELSLVSDYAGRAWGMGRGLSLGPVSIVEIDERKAKSRDQQSAALLQAIPRHAGSVALDERGRQLTSPELAGLIERERDRGLSELVFLIGGADGHAENLISAADHRLSLGPMVWPHMLARVMLSEQIYRAVSILSGSPYHRA